MKKKTQTATMMSVGIIPRSRLMKYLSMELSACLYVVDLFLNSSSGLHEGSRL